ncbi:hypothetical protein T4A_11851 [Trichinella pseudospiralis]|uniref:Uncharacterized protein n=1 Tax=Trichinella pseudospiralis TaxID=6337 RepID=A0A0V1DN97_TRIPS|nr:hypothetical protein T4A_11851 [Trichinella pseudospiralis]
MNRNAHGEERRQVEKATRSGRIGWIELFVSEDTLDGEDTIYRSRV